ncbi:glycosyltransferase family 39 protein [Cohnella nanjingensis]|uniref:Glycosyltransferase family 39 protein n=2 Tax=Cohnella nanjingensis TaxID=1387779 RepID=A0A7X0RV59_9BACL|nr:glycosyltransferase family 39 protein [Cohnella nanjingensis]MBB6674282.1 glycosyltransferase family 39 protein [Cohnella nanjingensis]
MTEPTKRKRADITLAAIALLSAFLNAYNIWLDQTGNAYYTAAVTSMLQNFHAFFYASLDSVGFVTVDKPPVTFWVQTASAYLFGVHGWSVILPQALAGIGSVLLLYAMVRPTYGLTAARLAALAMACTPIAVAVARTNNVDALLVFTLLLAAWMLLRGARSGQWGWALGAFAMIGVAFNEKMLQAYMVLPAFYLFYVLAYRMQRKKKIVVLTGATAVMVVLSLSWALAVDLTAKDSRPYIGSSQTNSVMELAFGYNGISRLTGNGSGVPGGGGNRGGGGGWPGGTMSGDGRGDAAFGDGQGRDGTAYGNGQGRGVGRGNAAAAAANGQNQGSANASGTGDGQAAPGMNDNADAMVPDDGMGGNSSSPDGVTGGTGGNAAAPDGGMNGNFPGGAPPSFEGGGQRGGAGGAFNTGKAGPLRLFQSALSGQISWLLPFAFLSAVGLLAGVRRRQPLTDKQRMTLFWLAWLLPGMVFFSIAGFFHSYYLIMLAPPIAALFGAGWNELREHHRAKRGWLAYLFPGAIAASAAYQIYILSPYASEIGRGWIVAVGLLGVGSALVLAAPVLRPPLVRAAAVCGLLGLMIAPLYWSATPLLYGGNSMIPSAGPDLNRSAGRGADSFGGMNGAGAALPAFTFGQGAQGGRGGESGSVNEALYAYLTQNNTGEPYLFATSNVNTAESYIIKTGKAVMAMGGFSGSDPILTVDKVKQLVADGKVKYFLLSDGGFGGFGGGPGGGSSEATAWIKENGKLIDASAWQSADASAADAADGLDGGGRMGGNLSLYLVQNP